MKTLEEETSSYSQCSQEGDEWEVILLDAAWISSSRPARIKWCLLSINGVTKCKENVM